MSTKILADGRIYGSGTLSSAGAKLTITGSYITTSSTITAANQNSPTGTYLGFESLSSGTVTFNSSNAVTTDTFVWMIGN